MLIEISNGELFDKISILEIKLKKINDNNKLQHINNELDLLKSKTKNINIKDSLVYKLKEINEKLWELENLIRRKIELKEYDKEFIQCSINIRYYNDKRFEVKNEINKDTSSKVQEQKEHG